MSKYFLVIYLIIFTSILCQAQQKDKFPGLSQQDRKNYVLSIDQSKISKLRDTIIFKINWRFAYVLVKLSNISSDTLKYIRMTCSWDDNFIIDNKDIDIKRWSCDSNFPVVCKILPHKSSTFNVPLLFPRNIDLHSIRIGFYLFKQDKQHDGLSYFDDFLNSKPAFRNYLIWSNEIIITK